MLFYFILKGIFVLEIFTFLCWLFGYIEKRLNEKGMVSFKAYDVTDWTANSCNTHIAQYLKKERQPWNLVSHKNITLEIFFLKNRIEGVVQKLVPGPFIKNQNLAYLLINRLKWYKVCFCCMSKSRSTKIY